MGYVISSAVTRWTKSFMFSVLAAPADSTAYLAIDVPDLTLASASRIFKFVISGTAREVTLSLSQAVNASNETVNVYLRNITTATDYAVGTFTSDFGANSTVDFIWTGLSIPINTSDTWALKILTPAWGTNPTNWRGGGDISVGQ